MKDENDLGQNRNKYLQFSLPRKQIFINNLLGGFAWGAGATLGLAFLFAILGFVAHFIDFVPFIGSFISGVIDYILKTNPRFH